MWQRPHWRPGGVTTGVDKRRAPAIAVLLVMLPSLLRAQPPQPSFRAGIELIEVDASVVDGRGVPVEDLRTPEFTVTVDGQLRRVVSSDFIRLRSDGPDERRADTDPAVVFHSSNQTTARGRQIVIVVDRETLAFGEGAHVTRAASQFLETLSSNDRLAFVAVPQPGPLIDFTSNHRLVRNALDGMVGLAQTPLGELNIGLIEAFALESIGHSVVAVRLVERLCGHLPPGELDFCVARVRAAGARIVAEQRRRTDATLRSLESILEALLAVQGPKHIVWISSGLVIDGPGARLRPIERLAADARATIDVLMLDEPLGDISTLELRPTPIEDRRWQERGLELLAGMTRGALRWVGPNANAPFERLAAELSGFYLLGIESRATDKGRGAARDQRFGSAPGYACPGTSTVSYRGSRWQRPRCPWRQRSRGAGSADATRTVRGNGPAVACGHLRLSGAGSLNAACPRGGRGRGRSTSTS